jgi:cysteinyl-tRNA synthetase
LLTGCLFTACSDDEPDGPIDPFYREAMRQFVINIRTAADALTNGFILIPQNGHDLLQETNGDPSTAYLAAIDGVGREDLFYGYDNDNQPTPAAERSAMLPFLITARDAGIRVLVTDYVWDTGYKALSLASNDTLGFAPFQAPDRELREIPATVNHQHDGAVTSLAAATNFLYLLNPEYYATRGAYLTALSNAPHDLLIIDAFYNDTELLTRAEVDSLKCKPGTTTRRLVVAYMSIGEAESYRWYWQPSWQPGNPAWLAGVNPDWPGNYKVRYWDTNWQAIICATNDSYLSRLVASGFDGAYLDIIDAFEYFE